LAPRKGPYPIAQPGTWNCLENLVIAHGRIAALNTSAPLGVFIAGSRSAVTNKSKLFAGVMVLKLAFSFLSTFSWRYAAENENFVLVVLASAFDSTVCRHSEF